MAMKRKAPARKGADPYKGREKKEPAAYERSERGAKKPAARSRKRGK